MAETDHDLPPASSRQPHAERLSLRDLQRRISTPEGGVILACTIAAFVSLTPTVNTVFGFFLVPLSEEFQWSRSSVSIVLFIVAVTASLTAPIFGWLIDRYGARQTMVPGLIIFAASVAALSLVDGSRLHFYANYALVGAAGGAVGPVILTKVISTWFDRNRGFALGLVGGVGNGVGATFMPVYVHFWMTDQGWRAAYLGLGGLILVLGLPMLLMFLRDAPQTDPKTDGSQAIRNTGLTLQEAMHTPAFWILLSAIALGAGSMTAVFTHVIPMLQDRGMSFDQATAVLTTFALVTVIWQICIGVLLDRAPRPRLVAPFFVVAVVGLALLISSSNFALLLLAGALMGIGLGTEYGVLPFFLSRYFGLKAYGLISGVTYGVITLVMGLTPYLMDLSHDQTGSYNMSGFVIGASLLAGAFLITLLPPFRFTQQTP